MFRKGLSFAVFYVLFSLAPRGTQPRKHPRISATCRQHVKITTGKLTQTREVRSGDSYLSQRDLTLHFGIADYGQIDSIEVQWQSGAKQLIKSVPANQVLSLEEIRDE